MTRQEPYTLHDVEEALAFLDKWRTTDEVMQIPDHQERAETLERWFSASNIKAWNEAHPSAWVEKK